MINLADITDINIFHELITNGYINIRQDASQELSIFKYSKNAPYEFGSHWPEPLAIARGLILDKDYNVVGRPIQKFFNYGEVRLPSFVITKQPVATNKLDGSAILVCKYQDDIVISSLGSFDSEQAWWANKFWNEHYSEIKIPEGVTLVFEAIYYQNKIVVSYDYEDLVFITAIDNETGADILEYEWPGRKIETFYDVKDLDVAYRLANSYVFDDQEGIVLTWPFHKKPSFRLKIKNAEYIRLHALATNTSSTTVWETLRRGGSYEDLIIDCPDELAAWIRKCGQDIMEQYFNILTPVYKEFNKVKKALGVDIPVNLPPETKKEAAALLKNSKNKAMVFMLLDNKENRLREYIFKLIKPPFQLAYRLEEDA